MCVGMGGGVWEVREVLLGSLLLVRRQSVGVYYSVFVLYSRSVK